uniref:medium-chain acyl-CoA ligase n=2 Tax=Ixodes ricinus TaxID=34613 RepID=V5GL74_IXORI
MVILPKTPEFWLIKLAALRCGIILTSCTSMLTSKDIGLRLTKFAPHCMMAGEGQADAVDQVIGGFPGVRNKVVVSGSSGRSGWKSFSDLLKGAQEFEGVETLRDDPAFVFFTSGTTGPPKMVEHSQGYCLANLATATYFQSLHRSDVFWCISDTGWAKVAWGTFPAWLTGACLFQARMPRFSPETTLSVLCDYPITKLCAPPTVYRALLQLDPSLFKFRSLNDCVSAGEPMVALCASPVDKVVKPGSMGLPLPNVTIQIHDDEGRELGPNEIGHMAVATTPRKPFGLFTCYRDEPSKTETAFRNGFYYTGDKGYKDNDGYLWFYARADDVIISAGYRIGPFEVESVLAEHPAVAECAVVGSPDPNRGEVVKAFVVLRASHRNIEDLDGLAVELQEFVKKNTAPYKYPRKVEFVGELPKTISGKVLRTSLREREKPINGA